MTQNEAGWDLFIIQKLLEGYGYIDSETGKLYVWINGIGEQEVTTTLQNMLVYLKYLRDVSDEQGEESAGLRTGGLAGQSG